MISCFFLPSSVSICGSTSNHVEDTDRALQRPTCNVSDDHQYGKSIAIVVNKVENGTVMRKTFCRIDNMIQFQCNEQNEWLFSLYIYVLMVILSLSLSHDINWQFSFSLSLSLAVRGKASIQCECVNMYK